MSRRRSRWRFSAGAKPHTVIVEEREPGGPIYARVWDPSKREGRGNWIRRSLGHTDRDRAQSYALEQAAKLKKGRSDLQQEDLTLVGLFRLYELHRTPRKTVGEQKQDLRRIEMWTRVLGPDKDPHEVSLAEWERFIDLRLSGKINARGVRGDHRPVGPRTVEGACDWLRWVFNWAVKWRLPSGHYLMRENPVRGFDTPREVNPSRPAATQDRFAAIRAVSDEHSMEARWGGSLERCRSHLTELLEIVNGSGRRISAVCQLRFDDLKLSQGPYGSIRWPADTDKMGLETVIPVTPRVRGILDRIIRERPGVGGAPLFPSPADPAQPMTRHLADKWLREGERLAGVKPQKGSLWHAYRRKWATERKHLPDADVAAAGGWKNTVSLKTAYQQADPETILRVVLEAGELREAR